MYLAIDVGGTKTLLATFQEDGATAVKEVQFPTPATYEDFLEDLKSQLPLLGVFEFTAAAAGVPGRIDREKGIGISFGNLDWKDVPIKKDLEKILECPVYIENDAKVGGLSEAMLIKDDFKKILYITIGTGIGTTIITNGIIDTNFGDLGGKEVIVEQNGHQVEWESIASGSAIKKQFGKKASEITDEASWEIIAHNLSLGLIKLIKEKQPDAIVFGGGAGKHFDRYGELLKQELSAQLGASLPTFLPAMHAEEAVVYGCIELIKQNYEKPA
jgi:glucokinase